MIRLVLLTTLSLLIVTTATPAAAGELDTGDTAAEPIDTGDDTSSGGGDDTAGGGDDTGGGGSSGSGGGTNQDLDPSGDADGYGTNGPPTALSGGDGGCGSGGSLALAWLLAMPLAMMGAARRS